MLCSICDLRENLYSASRALLVGITDVTFVGVSWNLYDV